MYKGIFIVVFLGLFSCNSKSQNVVEMDVKKINESYEVVKSEEEWKAELGEEAYNVIRKKGTEYAFTGIYNDLKDEGVYCCKGCGNKLFESDTKYNSGSGWPSFFAPVSENSIKEIEDNSFGMKRTEVVCARCGGHLGHSFPDGPKPTGTRYCVNSISLDFKKEKE